jgi:hypothetical protein
MAMVTSDAGPADRLPMLPFEVVERVTGEGGGDREDRAGADENPWAEEDEEWGSEEQGDEPQDRGEQEPEEEREYEEERESDTESSSGALAGEAAAGPSMGPHTDVRKFREGREEALEKLADAGGTDALGLDKRRQVVGGTYGLTRTKLLVLYGTTVAVIAGAAFGLYLLAKDLDQPPEKISAEAPWSEQDAPQRPPKGLQ